MPQIRQLAAIMFTDVVGYTSMMAKNEQVALDALQKVRDLLKPLIDSYNGKWLKEIGDGTLSSFSSALDAVNCAIDFQRAIREEPFKVRIGIHVGEVTLTEDDIFGDGVNIASRIEPLAPPGGIYITDRVYEDILNKPEITTAYVGTRSLKNVDRLIKVYTITGEGFPPPPKQPASNKIGYIIKDLWQRRMPQILFIYLAVSFLIVKLIQWILVEFMLSPHWSDFTMIFLLSMYPSVGVISYYHGKSGMERWVKAEKIFIPANLVITTLVLIFVFEGKDLGATTREIKVQDEEGNTIERIVPKNQFIKNIAVFNFENYTDDPDMEWLSTGINLAFLSDLDQDKFISPKGTESFYDELKRKKIEKLDNVPFQLKRTIAKDFRLDYILGGGFDRITNGFQINTQLYETENGKLISEHTVEGPDIFDLIDQLTVRIKTDLGIPESYIKEAEDLKVSNLLTSSFAAFKDFTKSHELISYRNDYDNSIKFMQSALEKDPDFVMVDLNLAAIYVLTNRFDQAAIHTNKVMDKLYLMPERDQFLAKSLHYYVNEQHEKRIKVIEMWIDLYPEDVTAYKYLSQIHRVSGEPKKAESVLKSALQIDDNRGNFYVDLADVLMTQGKKEEALSYYNLYAEKYPDHARSFRLIGDYYFDEGNLEEAEKNFEKSLLLEDDDITSMGKLAMIKERRGNFEEAENDFADALKKASTSGDSLSILNMQINFYLHTGQIKKVIEIWEETLSTSRNVFPPLVISIFKVTRLYWYFLSDQSDIALDIIQQEESKFSGPFKDILAYGYLSYYIDQGNIEKAEEEYTRMERYISRFGSSGNIEKYYEAEILYLKEEFQAALDKFLEFKSVNTYFPKDVLDIKIVKCYTDLNLYSEAVSGLEEMLKLHPFLADAHFWMAKILLDQNKKEKAKEHLISANKVWENADPEYEDAQEAMRLYESL